MGEWYKMVNRGVFLFLEFDGRIGKILKTKKAYPFYKFWKVKNGKEDSSHFIFIQ